MAEQQEAKARNFERIAEAIESDPEWFQDDEIDDADIVDALRLAAKAVRIGPLQP